MPRLKIKLDAFGRILLAERTAARWEVYDLGHDGKRRLASDIVVPDFVEDVELDTFIADLLHESATARHVADVEALAGLRQIQLRVGSENTIARALYASHGFERAAVLPRSLCCDGIYIDELLMVLDLARPT